MYLNYLDNARFCHLKDKLHGNYCCSVNVILRGAWLQMICIRPCENCSFTNVKVGSGEENKRDGKIILPLQMYYGDNVQALIHSAYPGIHNGKFSDQYFLNRTILYAKNDDVMTLIQKY